MESLLTFSEEFSGLVWGLPLIFALFGSGLVFSLIFCFPQIRHFAHAIRITFGKYDDPSKKGEITHFQALCAALSATLGLGNIAGVAIAISTGGPGAVFWMWVAGFLGMATKFTSISLALIFRNEEGGEVHGGPMYTIKNGLGKAFLPLAFLYAFFLMLSAFGSGNMFQSNQLSKIIYDTLHIPTYVTGIVFALLAGFVLLGGIKRIAQITEKIVPFMVVLYFVSAIGILLYHYTELPGLLLQIVNDAFTGTAAVGGFAGVAFKEVLIQGVRRGVFSNEAGMGSAACAHSAAKSDPIQEGLVGLLGPFIDTIIVCTMTALVILITNKWQVAGGMAGVELTSAAFETIYGHLGKYIVMLSVIFLSFSTIISWSYYGEQGITFMVGEKGIMPYRLLFILCILIGAVVNLKLIINISDAFFGLLAIPNLIANLLLTKKLKKKLKEYERNPKNFTPQSQE